MLVDDDGGQQEDLAVAPLVVALLHIVRLRRGQMLIFQASRIFQIYLQASVEPFGCCRLSS